MRERVLNKSELFRYIVEDILDLSGFEGKLTSIEYIIVFLTWVKVWVLSFGD